MTNGHRAARDKMEKGHSPPSKRQETRKLVSSRQFVTSPRHLDGNGRHIRPAIDESIQNIQNIHLDFPTGVVSGGKDYERVYTLGAGRYRSQWSSIEPGDTNPRYFLYDARDKGKVIHPHSPVNQTSKITDLYCIHNEHGDSFNSMCSDIPQRRL